MIKRSRFPKIFFGWWTVIGGGILALWGHGYYTYGMSALFKPLAEELHFTRTAAAIPTSIGRLEGGFESPLSGWMTDRFGPRWVVFFGIFLIGLSLILMYYIQSLWAFYLVWGVMLGTGVNIALAMPVNTAITNWFVKKRGKALGIKDVFSGLSGALVVPLIAWLIIMQGWRMTVLIGGVVMLVIGLPISVFCLKQRRPEYYGMLPDGARTKEEVADTREMVERGIKYAAEAGEIEFSLQQALKTPAYWLLVLGNGIHSLSVSAMNIHTIPFLTDMGIDPVKAAAMMALMVGISVPARFIGGVLCDRLKKNQIRYLLTVSYVTQAAGFVIVLLSQSIPMLYLFFVIFGVGKGIGLTAHTLIKARYFGRKAFGSIRGTSVMFSTPFNVIAPVYAAWVYDTTGNYMSAFTVFAVLGFLSTAMIGFVFPPKSPAQITDIRKLV